jgi:chromosome segregation ATPase
VAARGARPMKLLRALVGATPPEDWAQLEEIAARDEVQRAVAAKSEIVQGLESAIHEFDEPERAKEAAEGALKDFRRTWAANGATYTDTLQLHAFEKDLKEKTAAAEHAAPNREALRRELARVQSSLESLHVDLQGCEKRITGAIAMMAVQEHADLLADLVKDAERYRTTQERVMGLRLALQREWSLLTKNSMDPSNAALTLIDAAIDRAEIKSWEKHVDNRRDPQGFLATLKAPWLKAVAKLRSDSNA